MDPELVDLMYVEEILDDEDYVLMNLPTYEESLLPRMSLDLENMTNLQSRNNFRFDLDDLPRLAAAMRFSDVIHLDNDGRCTGLEVLCVVLRRLVYPCRLNDLEKLFGKSSSSISRMFNRGLEHIHERFATLLDDLPHAWLSREELEKCAKAIFDRGSPYDAVIGFVDGTVNACCRPGGSQQMVYNGYRRVHALKYQFFTSPNGIILHLEGPIIGKRHDNRIYNEGTLASRLDAKMAEVGAHFYAYGDQGYRTSKYIQAPFRTIARPEEAACNKAMSGVRISIEWIIGRTLSLFAFLDFEKKSKTHASASRTLLPCGCFA